MKIIKLLLVLFLIHLRVDATNNLPENNYKYIITYKVLSEVALTFGDNRVLPLLEMPITKTSKKKTEFYAKPEPLIIFDEKLYDICRSMGKDSMTSIALLLGHELTHYYENHAEWGSFLEEIKKDELSREVKVKKENERNADLRGIFQAFAAGYNCFSIINSLYQKIYDGYSIKSLPEYYSMEERINFALSEQVYAKKIGYVLEMGNFLYLNGNIDESEKCYNYVANSFPLNDVLFNQANCLLSKANNLTVLSQVPFKLPISISANNKLLSDLRGTDDLKRESYLKAAIRILLRIINQNPSYENAYISLGAAYLLQGKDGSANDIMNDWENQTKHQNSNGYLIKAIIYAKNQKKLNSVLRLLNGIYEEDYNKTVLINYHNWIDKNDKIITDSLINHEKKKLSKSILPKLNQYEQYILPNPSIEITEKKINITNEIHLKCYAEIGANNLIFNIETSKNKYSVIKPLNKSEWKLKEGLKKGDTVEAVENKLGVSLNKIVNNQNTFWLGYLDLGYWFLIKDNKLENVYIFSNLKTTF